MVGPSVAGKFLPANMSKNIESSLGLPFPLFQPANQDNDNTQNRTETGTGKPGYSGPGLASMTTGANAKETDSSDSEKFRFV